MPDADDIADAVAESAAGPKRVKVNGREVEQHLLKDQIEAAKHAAANEQVRSTGRLIFNKISPPGAA